MGMTDVQSETNTQEAEKAPKVVQMTFKAGDTVTVQRGLNKGKSGEVLHVSDVDKTYAVKFEDGGLAIINAVNVKTPDEGQIQEGALAAIVQTGINEADPADALAGVRSIVALLEKALPGFSERVHNY